MTFGEPLMEFLGHYVSINILILRKLRQLLHFLLMVAIFLVMNCETPYCVLLTLLLIVHH